MHDLRHTRATLALQAGVHPKVISGRLGHATMAMTLRLYAHAIPALQHHAAVAIADRSAAWPPRWRAGLEPDGSRR